MRLEVVKTRSRMSRAMGRGSSALFESCPEPNLKLNVVGQLKTSSLCYTSEYVECRLALLTSTIIERVLIQTRTVSANPLAVMPIILALDVRL